MVKNSKLSSKVLVFILAFAMMIGCMQSAVMASPTDESMDENGTEEQTKMGMVTSGQAGWVSGDIHNHSRYSDGSGTIFENFAQAQKVGMDFINISDHDNSRGWADAQVAGPQYNIIPIWGNEYSGYGHAVFMNVNQEKNYNAGVLPKAAIDNFKADTNGEGLAYAAHPYDGTVEADPWGKNDSWNADLDGIEVWNGWYASNYTANAKARVQWDILNNQGRHLYGIADTDTHSAAGIGSVYTTVYVDEYSVEGIVNGFKAGHMYGSNGPVIDFSVGSVMMGDDVAVPQEGKYVDVDLSGYYIEDLARVLLIKNGEIVYTKNIDAASFNETVEVFVNPGDFIRMEVEGKETATKKLTNGSYSTPAFDTSAPFAFSNPIFFFEQALDKTALNDKIAEAELLNRFDYTHASWNDFQTALNEAKRVSLADETSQNEIDTALETLVAAINALKTPEIYTTVSSNGDGQAHIDFAIRSANGKDYTAWICEDYDGTYYLADANFNSQGAHVKSLTNGKTYYAYILYADGAVFEESNVVILNPSI